MLVAPVTTPGTTATTSVWFPPGRWTDYFTGKTYQGGTTQQITSGLDTMPVFVKAGAIVPTRTGSVPDDDQSTLAKATLTVSPGASGSFTLYEDDGTHAARHATTTVDSVQRGSGARSLRIGATKGSFAGQPATRSWTVAFLGATSAPHAVTADGRRLSAKDWRYDAASGRVTVTLPPHGVHTPVTVTLR
jgi:hypothetical protein